MTIPEKEITNFMTSIIDWNWYDIIGNEKQSKYHECNKFKFYSYRNN